MIYVDSDSTTHNWHKACCELFNHPYIFDDPKFTCKTTDGLGLTNKQLWEKIDSQKEKFWSEMEPLPWFEDLIKLVNQYDEWRFLTSPSLSCYAASGKVLWFQKYFGKHFKKYIITPKENKPLLAYHNVLIDDMDENCELFTKAGGHSIVFPGVHNSNNNLLDKRLEHVREKLEQYYS